MPRFSVLLLLHSEGFLKDKTIWHSFTQTRCFFSKYWKETIATLRSMHSNTSIYIQSIGFPPKFSFRNLTCLGPMLGIRKQHGENEHFNNDETSHQSIHQENHPNPSLWSLQNPSVPFLHFQLFASDRTSGCCINLPVTVFRKKKTGQIDTFQESPWLFTRDPYGLWYNPHITGWYNPRCNNLNNQGPKLFIAQLTPTELVENQKRTTMSHATMRFNCRHQDV